MSLSPSSLPYPSLIDQIGSLLQQAKTKIVSQVNHTMVMAYRTIGQYIVEYEQKGADRAEYGSGLLQKLSDDLTAKFGKGFTKRNLELIRQFYVTYSKANTVFSQSSDGSRSILSRSHYIMLMRMEEKERRFYEIESLANNRSLRELKRQFDSGLYLRLAMSKDKGEQTNQQNIISTLRIGISKAKDLPLRFVLG